MADRDRAPGLGDLNTRLTWQSRTSAPLDGSCGEGVDTWTTQATLWAKVVPVNGQILFNAEQLKSLREHSITMRGGPDIHAGDRLLLKGTRILTVTLVSRVDEQGFWLSIRATEQGAAQLGGP